MGRKYAKLPAAELDYQIMEGDALAVGERVWLSSRRPAAWGGDQESDNGCFIRHIAPGQPLLAVNSRAKLGWAQLVRIKCTGRCIRPRS